MPRIGFFSSSERARHYPWHRITIEGDGIIRWAANEERGGRPHTPSHDDDDARKLRFAVHGLLISSEQRMDAAGRMAGGGDHASEMTGMAHSINAM